MLKKSYCIIILLLSCRMVCGQVLIALVFGDKLSNGKMEMGVQLAAQGFQFTGIDDRLDVGFSFGAYLDWKFSERLSLANYFMFKSPKGGRNIPQNYWLNQTDIQLSDGVSVKRHLTYLELTPLFRYQLNRSWALSVGPQVALNVKGTDTYQEKSDDGIFTYRTHIRDYITLMDAGVAVDIQWRLMKGTGLRINVRFAQGLVNTIKDGELFNAKNQTYQAGVGIPIGGHKNK